MRHDYPRERTSAVTWLICGIIGGFALQLALGADWLGGRRVLENDFALSIHGLRQGWIWTLATHAFLSEPGYLFHAAGIVFCVYFIGRELEPLIGARRLLGLFFGATVAGGLAWTAAHWRLGGTHVGAMAAVDAMLVVFACFYPNRQWDFLLFFVLPVRLRAKHVVLGLIVFDLIGLVPYEIMGAARPFAEFTLAHSAHLGGMAAGWIYFRFVHEARWRAFPRRQSAAAIEAGAPAAESGASSDPAPTRDLRAEVDRILDKINSHGFSSLTPQEKRVLDEAKDSLSRRQPVRTIASHPLNRA